MAINSRNFVDISTTFPSAEVSGRAFGGLVFTAAEMQAAKDKFGNLIPTKENGDAYPQVEGTNIITYYADAAKLHAWVWNEDVKNYQCEIDGEVVYPGNASDISVVVTYDSGEPVSLNLNDVRRLFGTVVTGGGAIEDTPEYDFAIGYYGYVSPSGRFASALKYAKVLANENPSAAFSRVDAKSNMFGSFTFLSVPSGDDSDSVGETVNPSLAELQKVAAINSGLDTKYLFVVSCPRGSALATDVVKDCRDYFGSVKGTCFISAESEVSAYMPMAIFASTDYESGQVVNFMFKQFGSEKPTVTDDRTYTTFNKGCVNFYGRTQTNGQTIDFYQRGFNTDGTDSAIYCNEVWFKASCETALLSAMISRERLPANDAGVDFVVGEVMTQCQAAYTNGTFSAKAASIAEEKQIRELVFATGGNTETGTSIINNVAEMGYSVYGYLSQMQSGDQIGAVSEYVIVYYVFYGTADSVRFIKGNNILIK